MKYLLGLQLLNLIKYAELTESVRQNDELSMDLLNKLRVGYMDDDSSVIWDLLAQTRAGLFQILNHLKTLKYHQNYHLTKNTIF